MPREFLTQVGMPVIEQAFNGLHTITRTYDVNAGGMSKEHISQQVLIPYGTQDEQHKAALLVKRQIDQSTIEKSGYELRLFEVYQEFRKNEKVSVEEDQITKLPDGRTQMVRRYVCLSNDAENLAAAIGTVVDGRACANVVVSDQGLGAEIVETYISAGKLSQVDSDSNNGALLRRSVTYFNQVPPGEAGYVLVDQSVRDVQGLPFYTYQYAKGNGEISRSTNYNQSNDAGTTGITIIRVSHLTGPAVGANPIGTPGGFVRVSDEMDERDGHRFWQATFAKGTGLVAENISPRQDGLREVTWVSLGTRLAPDGVIVRDDWRMAEGFKVFVVGTIQSADGGSPVGVEITFERYVPFTYPGRAKAFTEEFGGKTMLDVFLSPPVTTQVLATVKVSYQTTPTIGGVGNLWNPREWATLRAQWQSYNGEPTNEVRALTGYRAVGASASVSGTTVAPSNATCRGQLVFGGTTARIIVTGGPSDPGGTTLTLDVTVEPAFTASNGTKYYRRTEVTAAIPSQDNLPV